MLAPVGSIHTRRWVETLAERGHEVTYLNLSDKRQEFRSGNSSALPDQLPATSSD